MADPRSLTAGHGRHDPLLVAAAVGRGTGAVPTVARALLAACTECAGLHRDLHAIAAALPSTAMPARPRDYTLRATDAARLRPGRLGRWLRRLGSSTDALSRPLAMTLTTLGLAGLLVAAVPAIGPAAAGPVDATLTPEVIPMVVPSGEGFGQHVPTGGNGDAPRPAVSEPGPPAGPPLPFVLLSSAFTLAGGALFAGRRIGRHLAVR